MELTHPEEFRRLNAARELERLGFLDDVPGASSPATLDTSCVRDDFRTDPLSLPDGCEALERAVQDWMTPIRRAAAIALGLTGDPDAFMPLKKLVRDGDSEVRAAAVIGLARLSTQESIDHLGLLLLAPAGVTRLQIIRALRESTLEDAAQFLWGILDSPDEEERAEAVRSIGIQARPPTSCLRREPYFAATVDLLVQALADARPSVRWEAVWALGKIGKPMCLIALNAALGDEAPEIREEAALVLERLGVEATPQRACLGLDHLPPSLRASAARRLRSLADITTAACLCGALGDPDPHVRREVAAALESIGQCESTDLLAEALRSSYRHIRQHAAIRLGERGTIDAVPHLLPFLNSGDGLSLAAASSLARLGALDVVPCLVGWLRHEDAEVRDAAVAAFRTLGWRGALPDLRKRLRTFGGEPDPEIRSAIKAAIRQIEAASRHRSELPVIAFKKEADNVALPIASHAHPKGVDASD